MKKIIKYTWEAIRAATPQNFAISTKPNYTKNILAEFASVVDSVNCAAEIQRDIAERNAELPDNRRMQFRIGVNLGDVIEEEGRIYGDGVNIAARVEAMAETGCDCLGVDWTTDLADARSRVGNKVALQGNMDPSILYGSDERIRAEVKTILDSFGRGDGHVFNLGHGIHQHVDPEHAKVFIEAVHELSGPYHQ